MLYVIFLLFFIIGILAKMYRADTNKSAYYWQNKYAEKCKELMITEKTFKEHIEALESVIALMEATQRPRISEPSELDKESL